VRLQREVGITSIYVTHDQSEALVMSDRVVVMNRGKIQQVGDPHTIYAHPETAFVASFIGATNLLDCILVKRSGSHCQVEVPLGAGQAAASVLAMSAERTPLRERLVLSIRPEDIALHIIAPPPAGEMNCLQGEVVNTVYLGSFLECRVRVGMHELTVQLQHFAELASGQRVFLTFSADHGLCLMGDGVGPENDELRRRADPLARIGPTTSA
jgi:ABC-type Fe3+/spermidine/putrescine transport system ATPase subunit